MSVNPLRKRVHEKLASAPGVRAVRRPVTPEAAEQFNLHYVRSGPLSAHPIVIIPGGPGVASIQLYQATRRRAAAAGLDVVMVEHRGVGLSRHDDAGHDLPPEAITVAQVVDDVAAVLDDLGVEQAMIYGTSYGSYIAAGVGVRHPQRVKAMVLDSPVLSARDIEAIRHAIRGLLLEGEVEGTEELAAKVRRLVDDGTMDALSGEVAATVYAYGGAPLLSRLLDLLLTGHTLLWRAMTQIGRLSLLKVPYHNEIDLVGRIAFRELDYAGVPDGLPLDPSDALLEMADQIPGPTPEFEGEPYDLVAEMPRFDWPTVVVSGQRDLTTPPPVAERVAALIPGAVLVPLATAAHSALDSREAAALRIVRALVHGRAEGLPAVADELDALPGNQSVRLLVWAVSVAAALEARLPGRTPTS
ncbi:alpha/beta hydrolase [Mycolicibacterium confluentis]|uniref:Alpha/beta hydrolase n=1 Tax=Mycolicibacterium confluentis TaxID=28047 RepID=A0A7I7XT35_9MYCO|nr:alpha/beta hydrolase [Mycolicibacterium confluentis]MCV7321147.1 alpha/beta hydrolase [Mycolicibacterium confluentis]ORV21256.1 alpha/beta hydrolase [Mycolicibacterium confluentis]BBZ32377.1 alpha/beta hydrolase [Mycolicibacterium confluentis]